MLIIGSGAFFTDFLTSITVEYTISELVVYNDLNIPYPDFVMKDFRVLQNDEEVISYFQNEDNRFIVAIGSNMDREKVSKKFIALGGNNITYISSKATVGKYSTISSIGVIIPNFAYITNGVTIGEGVLMYAYTGIGHYSEIGKYCMLSCNVVMSDTKIGDYCEVGIGVSFVPGNTLGNHCRVGTGSVVTKSFEDNSTIIGNPAKKINI